MLSGKVLRAMTQPTDGPAFIHFFTLFLTYMKGDPNAETFCRKYSSCFLGRGAATVGGNTRIPGGIRPDHSRSLDWAIPRFWLCCYQRGVEAEGRDFRAERTAHGRAG